MRTITRINAALLALFTALVLIVLMSCVSTHEVLYEEVQADGSYITTHVKTTAPVGAKDLSEGGTQASVSPDGSWALGVNSRADMDLTGTAEFYRAIVQSAIEAGIAAGLAAAASGAVSPALTGP